MASRLPAEKTYFVTTLCRKGPRALARATASASIFHMQRVMDMRIVMASRPHVEQICFATNP